jgi:hypothetical protein
VRVRVRGRGWEEARSALGVRGRGWGLGVGVAWRTTTIGRTREFDVIMLPEKYDSEH